jgi:hypothetical protein
MDGGDASLSGDLSFFLIEAVLSDPAGLLFCIERACALLCRTDEFHLTAKSQRPFLLQKTPYC